jgi:Cu(I)/Ag(I) efflux system membrane fusion protein
MKLITALFVVVASAFVSQLAAAADLPAALVDPYLAVQAALSSDKFDGVTAAAQQIETAAVNLGSENEGIVAGAKKLSAAKDIAAARVAFGEVSAAIVEYAEKTKSGFGKDVRLAYCPMVKKPWLQKEETIRNPYYGSSMLICGNFK